MAQGRSTKIISMTKWMMKWTIRLSIQKSLSEQAASKKMLQEMKFPEMSVEDEGVLTESEDEEEECRIDLHWGRPCSLMH